MMHGIAVRPARLVGRRAAGWGGVGRGGTGWGDRVALASRTITVVSLRLHGTKDVARAPFIAGGVAGSGGGLRCKGNKRLSRDSSTRNHLLRHHVKGQHDTIRWIKGVVGWLYVTRLSEKAKVKLAE